jgi:DNA-binding transcriptional regulator YhcF (GntR family)
MKFTLNTEAAASLATQLATQFAAQIRSGALAPGARLPSIRQLASGHRISRFPVVEAYDQLVAQGLVRSRHGSGFFVAEHAAHEDVDPERVQHTLAEEESLQILQQFNPPGQALKLSSGSCPRAGATSKASRSRSATRAAATPPT